MSIVAVTVKCDGEGCTARAELVDPQSCIGWKRHTLSLTDRVSLMLDYCPDHTVRYAVPDEVAP